MVTVIAVSNLDAFDVRHGDLHLKFTDESR